MPSLNDTHSWSLPISGVHLLANLSPLTCVAAKDNVALRAHIAEHWDPSLKS
jgi:hypothetical protein